MKQKIIISVFIGLFLLNCAINSNEEKPVTKTENPIGENDSVNYSTSLLVDFNTFKNLFNISWPSASVIPSPKI